jgi:hypothetical protein
MRASTSVCLAVAVHLTACGPAAADADGSGDANSSGGDDGTASTTVEGATSTGEPSGLCLFTVPIDLDTIGTFVHFADVDGDGRPELWRLENLGAPGQGENEMLLDAFLVESNGSTTAIGTDQVEGSFSRFVDVDGDGGDDLIVSADSGADSARSWHRGQADLTFALPQPLSPIEEIFDSWLDADGDGDIDVFASHDGFEASVTLYLGDGSGELVSAGTLTFPIGAWISPVVPTDEPGVFIAGNYNGSDGFGAASSYWRIEVGADSVPIAVASTPELSHESLVAANDFDGDEVTDILTNQRESGTELRLWTAAGDGYAERTVATDAQDAFVGGFLEDGGVQLLLTDLAGGIWLLHTPLTDGAERIAIEGTLTDIYLYRVLDLDGDGQDDIVERTQDREGNAEYAMHHVGPCG